MIDAPRGTPSRWACRLRIRFCVILTLGRSRRQGDGVAPRAGPQVVDLAGDEPRQGQQDGVVAEVVPLPPPPAGAVPRAGSAGSGTGVAPAAGALACSEVGAVTERQFAKPPAAATLQVTVAAPAEPASSPAVAATRASAPATLSRGLSRMGPAPTDRRGRSRTPGAPARPRPPRRAGGIPTRRPPSAAAWACCGVSEPGQRVARRPDRPAAGDPSPRSGERQPQAVARAGRGDVDDLRRQRVEDDRLGRRPSALGHRGQKARERLRVRDPGGEPEGRQRRDLVDRGRAVRLVHPGGVAEVGGLHGRGGGRERRVAVGAGRQHGQEGEHGGDRDRRPAEGARARVGGFSCPVYPATPLPASRGPHHLSRRS